MENMKKKKIHYAIVSMLNFYINNNEVIKLGGNNFLLSYKMKTNKNLVFNYSFILITF